VVSAQPAAQRAHLAPSLPGGSPAASSPAEIAEVVVRLRAAPVGSAPEPHPQPSRGPQNLAFFEDAFSGPNVIGFEAGSDEGFADDPEAVFDLLRDAVAVGCPVFVGYEDPQTGYVEEVLEIVRIANGVVFARSPSRGGLHPVLLTGIEWAQLVGEHALGGRP